MEVVAVVEVGERRVVNDVDIVLLYVCSYLLCLSFLPLSSLPLHPSLSVLVSASTSHFLK